MMLLLSAFYSYSVPMLASCMLMFLLTDLLLDWLIRVPASIVYTILKGLSCYSLSSFTCLAPSYICASSYNYAPTATSFPTFSSLSAGLSTTSMVLCANPSFLLLLVGLLLLYLDWLLAWLWYSCSCSSNFGGVRLRMSSRFC